VAGLLAWCRLRCCCLARLKIRPAHAFAVIIEPCWQLELRQIEVRQTAHEKLLVQWQIWDRHWALYLGGHETAIARVVDEL